MAEEVKNKAVAKKSEKVEAELVEQPSGIVVRTAEEYAEYSLSQGRTRFGGEKGVKVPVTVEELRALINSNWRPSMVMEKFQLDEEEHKQLVWALSKKELRDSPIGFDLKHDMYRR